MGQSFIQKVKPLSPDVDQQLWKKATVHLLQACCIYKEHFELKEQVLFSTAFSVLDDIDYFFS